MEAASVSATPTPTVPVGLKEYLSKYGLIALLAAFPLYYAISDLTKGEGLTAMGDQLVNGFSNGAIWALVALGYTLVYGIIELINFSHGDVFMIGSFVSFGLCLLYTSDAADE